MELGLCARPQAPPDRTVGAGVVTRLAERPDRVPGRGRVAADLERGRRRRGASVPYTPYQVRHTHASWLIDQGVDLARVQYRLGHGDLQATTRYVKILDEEDPKAADVISAILGDVA